MKRLSRRAHGFDRLGAMCRERTLRVDRSCRSSCRRVVAAARLLPDLSMVRRERTLRVDRSYRSSCRRVVAAKRLLPDLSMVRRERTLRVDRSYKSSCRRVVAAARLLPDLFRSLFYHRCSKPPIQHPIWNQRNKPRNDCDQNQRPYQPVTHYCPK